MLGTLSALRQLSISEFAHPPPYEEADVRELLQQASHLKLFSYAMLHMTRDAAGFEVRLVMPAPGCCVLCCPFLQSCCHSARPLSASR